MSEKIKILVDENMETRIIENALKLNISAVDLIDRYVRRELYMDDYYKRPKLSKDEIIEILKKDAENDKKKGIFLKKSIGEV
ncbi:hypothetical protein [Methanobrevibacter sp.]|uniref:hypothetical protein n=1 Tax=Methanobrevibacter sp. TaxID=66852 RepID=UPI00386B2886